MWYIWGLVIHDDRERRGHYKVLTGKKFPGLILEMTTIVVTSLWFFFNRIEQLRILCSVIFTQAVYSLRVYQFIQYSGSVGWYADINFTHPKEFLDIPKINKVIKGQKMALVLSGPDRPNLRNNHSLCGL